MALDLTVDLLTRLDKPLPRYTSYPTAVEWHQMDHERYASALHQLSPKPGPISLYLHIPFCHSMCLFCGCAVVLNRRPENEQRYVEYLCREMALIASQLGERRPVAQLHFGGGTPTKLSEALLTRLMEQIQRHFTLNGDAEIAIEVDPRTVCEDGGGKLRHLRMLGFNRVSFGVQDTDPKVQEAVRRRQPHAMTQFTYQLARQLGFRGINIDLIYGLPYQTTASFAQTAQQIVDLRPDRLSFFSYAKVPWMRPHQKAIPETALPSAVEKFSIYLLARDTFLNAGYKGLGMDHFALPGDEIAKAMQTKTLHRNFQGYTLARSEELIGMGMTAIGRVSGDFFQGAKELETYYALLDEGKLPVQRGCHLSLEDRLRQWVIGELMCHFELDKGAFERHFGEPFDQHFASERGEVERLAREGLLVNEEQRIGATPLGQLFIRHVAAAFDAYLKKERKGPRFSQAV